MGDRVTAVVLDRDPSVIDIRETNGGRPRTRITDVGPRWTHQARSIARCLGLDYAVIDALPVGDELQVLEVNANGVWWFLPEVAEELEARFHAWVAGVVEEARSTSG
jgi:glutathione synthase/RimK-type ligase-like ATP-grasp enzyme